MIPPVKRNKVLVALRSAGGVGLSRFELSQVIFGDRCRHDDGRISGHVGALRRKGHRIITYHTDDRASKPAKYILIEGEM